MTYFADARSGLIIPEGHSVALVGGARVILLAVPCAMCRKPTGCSAVSMKRS